MDLMNVTGNWEEFRQQLRGHYSGLDDADAEAFRGNRARLMSLLETRYGMANPKAEEELDAILNDRGQPR